MGLNPKAVLGGAIAPTIEVFKGGAFEAVIVILTKDGIPFNLTGAIVTLEVYGARTRGDTPLKSFPVTLTTAAAGLCTLTVAGADMDLTTGTKYGWVMVVTDDPETYICDGMVTLQVG